MGTGQQDSASQHIQRLFTEGSLTGASDGELLERYLTRRDELAFEALVERHASLVLAVCRRSLDDAGDLDDAFQATFLVLARRSRAVRDRKALGSWLFGVARRVCLLANRAAARRRQHERRAAERRAARGSTNMEHDERGSLIDEEIERLPSAYRLPVVLCLMEGRSRAEAAEALQWTEGMVRGRLARARRLLRTRLIRRGVAPGAALAALASEGTAAGAVPRALIEKAARAATRAAAEGVSAATLALTEEVIKIMLLKKLTLFAAVLCATIVVAWAAAAALIAGTDQPRTAGAEQAGAAVRTVSVPASARGTIALDDPGKSALHGRVLAPDGKPVAGARVWAQGPMPGEGPLSRELAEARSDAEGRFRLGPIMPLYRNRFQLIVDPERFARLSIPRSAVLTFPGLDWDLGDIQVDPGRVFTGQVLDFDGKPRPGATIKPTVYRNYLGHSVEDVGPRQTVTTDSEGRFRTPPLPVGRLALMVQVPERQITGVSRPIQPGGEEDLGPIRLEKDVPVTGVVKDEEGHPIARVSIAGSVAHRATTDADGRFTLRGFGPNPSFQMNMRKVGYAPLVGRVTITEAGFLYGTRGDSKPAPPTKELVVILKRVGWIEGQAVDAETSAPVRLEKVVVSNFERRPSGNVDLPGDFTDFEQPEPGRFRASFPAPDEYHLTFSAPGYHDAEAYTPKATELKTIGGIVAKMKKKTEGSTPAIAKQTITGTVLRDGRPVKSGWVGLWRLMRQMNALNAPVLRGRTVVGPPVAPVSVPIHDGSYTLDVPHPSDDWYVVAEEPGYPLTQLGPLAIALNEKKTLDIACTEGGRVRGRVKDVPPGWEGHLWVVAFSKPAVREEARVAPDGTFSLPPLPPGEYGLKVGHDGYDDADVYPVNPETLLKDHPEAFKEKADPWKRAKVVNVEAGRETTGVELELPK